MDDGEIGLAPVVLASGFGLVTVEVEVAQGAWGDHGVGAEFACCASMVGDHAEGVALVDKEDRETTAGSFTGEVDYCTADRFDDGFEGCLALGVFVET